MPKAELGLKRGCLSCAMKFYDFNRTPIICPGCGAEFDPEALVRSRRGRAAAKPAVKAAKAAQEADPVETENDVDEAAEDEAGEWHGRLVAIGVADFRGGGGRSGEAGL